MSSFPSSPTHLPVPVHSKFVLYLPLLPLPLRVWLPVAFCYLPPLPPGSTRARLYPSSCAHARFGCRALRHALCAHFTRAHARAHAHFARLRAFCLLPHTLLPGFAAHGCLFTVYWRAHLPHFCARARVCAHFAFCLCTFWPGSHFTARALPLPWFFPPRLCHGLHTRLPHLLLPATPRTAALPLPRTRALRAFAFACATTTTPPAHLPAVSRPHPHPFPPVPPCPACPRAPHLPRTPLPRPARTFTAPSCPAGRPPRATRGLPHLPPPTHPAPPHLPTCLAVLPHAPCVAGDPYLPAFHLPTPPACRAAPPVPAHTRPPAAPTPRPVAAGSFRTAHLAQVRLPAAAGVRRDVRRACARRFALLCGGFCLYTLRAATRAGRALRLRTRARAFYARRRSPHAFARFAVCLRTGRARPAAFAAPLFYTRAHLPARGAARLCGGGGAPRTAHFPRAPPRFLRFAGVLHARSAAAHLYAFCARARLRTAHRARARTHVAAAAPHALAHAHAHAHALPATRARVPRAGSGCYTRFALFRCRLPRPPHLPPAAACLATHLPRTHTGLPRCRSHRACRAAHPTHAARSAAAHPLPTHPAPPRARRPLRARCRPRPCRPPRMVLRAQHAHTPLRSRRTLPTLQPLPHTFTHAVATPHARTRAFTRALRAHPTLHTFSSPCPHLPRSTFTRLPTPLPTFLPTPVCHTPFAYRVFISAHHPHGFPHTHTFAYTPHPLRSGSALYTPRSPPYRGFAFAARSMVFARVFPHTHPAFAFARRLCRLCLCPGPRGTPRAFYPHPHAALPTPGSFRFSPFARTHFAFTWCR